MTDNAANFHVPDYENYFYYAIQLTGPHSHRHADDVQRLLQRDIAATVEVIGRVGQLPDFYQIRIPKTQDRKRLEKRFSDTLGQPRYIADASVSHKKRIEFGIEQIKRLTKRSEDIYVHEHELLHEAIDNHPHIQWSSLQIPRRLYKRASPSEQQLRQRDLDGRGPPLRPPNPATIRAEFGIRDPIFDRQWHLVNYVDLGNDINVLGAWRSQYTGKNVTVCIIDDGVDLEHPDLKDNFEPRGSWDFNNPEQGNYPKPILADDRHGTRCAGEIAAVKNDECGIGVAFNAKISALRILSADIDEVHEAQAVNYGMDVNQIYSCSWGPSDDGKTLDGPSKIVMDSFLKGIHEGRQGKGNIYVFATGNGGNSEDNCNFDGYTNSIYTVSVGAIDRINSHPTYSETCSAQLCVTYSSGSGEWIHTTDVRSCTHQHGGTSAAAPIAAGVLALVLDARPDLTWRDVQALIVHSAIPIRLDDPDWQKTPAGFMVSHKYGYGKLDASRITAMARDWVLLGPQRQLVSPKKTVNKPMTRKQCVDDVIEVTKQELEETGLNSLEHVTATVSISHGRRGSVQVYLTSPYGVKSVLATSRPYDSSSHGFRDWTFSSVFHWAEPAVGSWKLTVCDIGPPSYKGTFENWQLSLFGDGGNRSNVVIPPRPSQPTPQPTKNQTHGDQEHDAPVQEDSSSLGHWLVISLLVLVLAAVGYSVWKWWRQRRGYQFDQVETRDDVENASHGIPLQTLALLANSNGNHENGNASASNGRAARGNPFILSTDEEDN